MSGRRRYTPADLQTIMDGTALMEFGVTATELLERLEVENYANLDTPLLLEHAIWEEKFRRRRRQELDDHELAKGVEWALNSKDPPIKRSRGTANEYPLRKRKASATVSSSSSTSNTSKKSKK